MIRWWNILTALFCLTFFATASTIKEELWVYTSLYEPYMSRIVAKFEQLHPQIKVNVFQSGSEKIQAKVETEILTHSKPFADVVMIADPFWILDLQKRNLLHDDNNKTAIIPSYYSAIVIIVHKSFPQNKRPKTFQDLVQPQYQNLIQFSNPMESGTSFSGLCYLLERYGWEFITKLNQNHMESRGGNSTVVSEVEQNRKKIGLALLVNALIAQQKGSPIDIIYPEDGAIPILNVQAIFKNSSHLKAAQSFTQFILTKESQTILQSANIYSVRTDLPTPQGMVPYKTITKNSVDWGLGDKTQMCKNPRAVKKKYSEMFMP